jgi:hypothetical protein
VHFIVDNGFPAQNKTGIHQNWGLNVTCTNLSFLLFVMVKFSFYQPSQDKKVPQRSSEFIAPAEGPVSARQM